MKNTNIGSRLLMAASFVENGDTVCDVGCDHGKLSYYLIKEGKAKHIIATDINKQPLQKAIDLFSENNISEKADFYLTDGLQNVEKTQNITHIVIAGLGGDTMSQIIDNAKFIKENKVQLVLIPAQNGHKIRRFLYQNGFKITKEKTVEDKGKFYTCINAVFSNEYKDGNIYDFYVGESEKDINGQGYFSLVLSQLNKLKKGQLIENGVCSEELQTAIDKLTLLIQN